MLPILSISDLKKRFPGRGVPGWLRSALLSLGLLRRPADGRDGFYRFEIDRLDIPSGIVALIGESGAGKSTLLNLLAGLDTNYWGSIKLHASSGIVELPRDEQSADEFRQEHFSFVFQTSNLLSNLRVSKNIVLSRCVGGDADDGCADLLSLFFKEDASSIGGRYPSELSGGQRQRVALCRALVKATDRATVLFADEPTASLDRQTAERCFEPLKAWTTKEPGRLLLLATHDLHLARQASHVIEVGSLARDEKTAGLHGVCFEGSWDEYERR